MNLPLQIRAGKNRPYFWGVYQALVSQIFKVETQEYVVFQAEDSKIVPSVNTSTGGTLPGVTVYNETGAALDCVLVFVDVEGNEKQLLTSNIPDGSLATMGPLSGNQSDFGYLEPGEKVLLRFTQNVKAQDGVRVQRTATQYVPQATELDTFKMTGTELEVSRDAGTVVGDARLVLMNMTSAAINYALWQVFDDGFEKQIVSGALTDASADNAEILGVLAVYLSEGSKLKVRLAAAPVGAPVVVKFIQNNVCNAAAE